MIKLLQQLDKSLEHKRVRSTPDSLSLLQRNQKLQLPGKVELATF
jgi:hypothetical protein